MKRSIFFLIIAVLNGFMGAFMTIAPASAAETFGMAVSPHLVSMMRSLGTVLLSLGVLDFLVRNEEDSSALRAVLIFNLLGHGLGLFFGILDVAQGIIEFAKVAPGLTVPLLGTLGSLFYLMKMKKQLN